MFGLFKSKIFHDSQLGEFKRSGGYWRGVIALDDSENIPLILAGNRTEPVAQAISMARGLAAVFASMRPMIESELVAHYPPYAEEFESENNSAACETMPSISAASQVWPYVALKFVSVTPLDGELIYELGYSVAWDEEHTLGARFKADQFIELCGSVLPP
ncbi:hypothetical protein [Methylomonas albis]|uniref:DUF6985 domain-containing protein n=1 Tax=Methylomonas albis TaxID=1854563 RepID=A0ABR9CUH8_9GAMM|nr:hypothetical protein [Methylomonas albis]MBD9354424.1 hypothetical protein [Methylomonas albis]CAD6877300.1 hypothetical protein [Methylomonas albis]